MSGNEAKQTLNEIGKVSFIHIHKFSLGSLEPLQYNREWLIGLV